MLTDKTILIFGGTGSLGYKFIERNSEKNRIYNFSRDECKHWKIELKYKGKITNIIGDIRNKERVRKALVTVKPNIVIIASAMKHVDRCEYSTGECINTNITGVQNILNSIEEINHRFKIDNVVFVSTDKACSPVNVYGMAKAISEKMIVESSLDSKHTKYNIVRYGNVLNSRGSIIPLLHYIGKSEEHTHYTLTDRRMTRFIMTLDQSCELIEYAISHGYNGETIVPTIRSMRLMDLFEIFSEIYGKGIEIGNLRPGEKLYESLINGTQYMLSYQKNEYYHIIPAFAGKLLSTEQLDLNSNMNIISKNELRKCLNDCDLLQRSAMSIF